MRIAQNVRIRKFPGEIDDHTGLQLDVMNLGWHKIFVCEIQKDNIQDVTMLQL